MNVVREKSCGIIPIKFKNGKPLYLLIHQKYVKNWGLPKGHKNPGETDEQTAKRELKEETDLEVKKLLKKAYVEKYVFSRLDRTIQKKVVYFVALVKPGKVKIQKKELRNYAWLSYSEAQKRLKFPIIKKILQNSQGSILGLHTHKKSFKPRKAK